MLARFPFLAQAAHGFAQAHGECGNRFQPLFSAVRKCAVILPVNFRQQEFGVTQNPGERIVEFMTQHLSKIFLRLFEWFVDTFRDPPNLAQAAADQAKRRRKTSFVALQIIGDTRIDQCPEPKSAAEYDVPTLAYFDEPRHRDQNGWSRA